MIKQKLLLTIPIALALLVFARPISSFETAGKAFVHGVKINVDGEDYYLAGPADGPNGEQDIPGHYWATVSQDQLVGRHVNSGPFGAANWWSSDAPDEKLLYVVHAVIARWSRRNANLYYSKGYVHYHELVKVSDGTKHPRKVVWLRHAAVRDFTLDGGPHPEMAHAVTIGVDWNFIPNWFMQYKP